VHLFRAANVSLESKKMTEPVGRMTARDALVYATGEQHASCTVKIKGLVRGGTIAFKCVCNVTYVIGASLNITNALRNVPEDRTL
jgi:hypothetical protein